MRIGTFSIMLFSSLLLSACGFHMRSRHELPAQLQTVYFHSDNPVAPAAIALKSMLTTIGIHLVNTPTQARYGISLTRPITSNSSPSGSTDNSNAYNITYTQKITISIVNTKTQATIISKTLSASRSQLLNRSQVLTANTASTATQDLPNDLATSAYLWLTTDDVRHAFNSPVSSQPLSTTHGTHTPSHLSH